MKNSDSYVVADIVVSVPSPSGPGNVDWSQLKGDSALASQIYQTDTKGGSPHGSCKPGSISEEKFSATFWLYSGASPNTTLPTSFTNDTPIRDIALPSNVTSKLRIRGVTPTTDVDKPHTKTKTKTQTKHHTSTKTKKVVKYHTITDAYISITTGYTVTATVTQTINSTTTSVTTVTSFTTPAPANVATINTYTTVTTYGTVIKAPPPPNGWT